MNSPLVSIIIPLYNAENFISECLCSVLKQTYKEIEIIVVNNNSTDGSVEVVQDIITKNPSKIQLVNEYNRGAPHARNKGLSLANGQFIQFLDADDKISSNKIEEQLKAFSPLIDVVISDYIVYSEKMDKIIEYKSFENLEFNPLEIAITNIITTCNPLYRKKIIEDIGGYDTSLEGSQDWEFHIRLVLKGYKFKYLKGQFFHYRKHSKSMSYNWVAIYKIACFIVDKYKYEIKDSKMFNDNISIHISSIYYLTYVFGNFSNKDYFLKNIIFWDKQKYLFIKNPIKRGVARILGLDLFLKFEHIIYGVRASH